MNYTTRRRSWAPSRIVSVYSYSISAPRSHVWHAQKLSLALRTIAPQPSKHAHSLRGLSNEDVLPEKGVMSRTLPRWVLRSGGLLTSLGSDYVLALSRGLASCLVALSSTVVVLSRTVHTVCHGSCFPVACILPNPIARICWGCTSTYISSCDYARGRPLAWYFVSHDGLCTIINRTIVLVVATLVC